MKSSYKKSVTQVDMNSIGIENQMIGEILCYESSNCIKREPENLDFYNEGIIENVRSIDEDKCNQQPELTVAPKQETVEKYTSASEERYKSISEDLIGEAIDFDCTSSLESQEDSKINLQNVWASNTSAVGEKNGNVMISCVNSPRSGHEDTKSFYIQQKNLQTDSVLLYKCNMCPTMHAFKHTYFVNDNIGLPSCPSQPKVKKPWGKNLTCEVPGCKFRTDNRKKLKTHAAVHSTESYKCDECAFVTKSEEYLERHKNSIHNPNAERFYCNQCLFNTTRKNSWKKHKMFHELSSPTPTTQDHHQKDSKYKMYCYNCSFQTHSKPSLKKHMLLHMNPESLIMLKCSHCSYTTKRKENLNQHMVKHYDKTNFEMLKCANCNFETKRKNALRNHMATHRKS
ncbi:uncharacterized protein [Leptinotarsa decemlineata]|uniref:uncharacterized protein n=1 Tax=Leptinotarsa decemlineata TaxID=7539 RepID=UPI003D304B19